MKKLVVLATLAVAGLSTSVSAADFGADGEAYVAPLPGPVLVSRPYNEYYEENSNYYASPYPLPYFGLFADWGPQYNFYVSPYWTSPEWGGQGPVGPVPRRYGHR